ncbi:hypothetical protein AOLI_G00253400 [Acnodon oligacanthus]
MTYLEMEEADREPLRFHGNHHRVCYGMICGQFRVQFSAGQIRNHSPQSKQSRSARQPSPAQQGSTRDKSLACRGQEVTRAL